MAGKKRGNSGYQHSLRDFKRRTGYDTPAALASARKYFRKARGGSRRYSRKSWGPRRRALNVKFGGALGVELKWYDAFMSATAVPDSSLIGAEMSPLLANHVGHLCSPVRGTGPQNRNATKIRVKSLHLQATIEMQAAAAAANPVSPTEVVLALVLNKNTNGTAADPTAVWEDMANGLNEVNARRVLENTDQFQVIKTEKICLSSESGWHATGYFWSGKRALIDWFVPMDVETKWTTAADTDASVTTVENGSLHLFAFSNNTAAPVYLAYTCRSRFVG